MRIGICPGSFDPVTNGHVDVFERSAKLVDKLIIAIFANPGKHPLFSMEEREELLRQAVGHIPNVEVVSFQGLLNEYAVERGATVIIRGLRAVTDFEYEFQRALLMKQLEPTLETVFIMSNTNYRISALRAYGSSPVSAAKLDGLVPDFTAKRLKEKFKDKYQI